MDCQEAKSFFAENGIDVIVKDIANEEIRGEMKEKFNRVMVPVIMIKGKAFIGFNDNKTEIKKILGK
jgi:glutaredoxin